MALLFVDRFAMLSEAKAGGDRGFDTGELRIIAEASHRKVGARETGSDQLFSKLIKRLVRGDGISK